MAKQTTAPAPATVTPVVAPETQPAPALEVVAKPAKPAPEKLSLPGGVAVEVATLNKWHSDAKSVVLNIPLVKGEEDGRFTAKGLTVKRLDAYDWTRVPVQAHESCKRALKILLAAQSYERMIAAILKG